jgi:hypothetical protein
LRSDRLFVSGENQMTGLRNSSAIGSLDSLDEPSDDGGTLARAGFPGDESVEFGIVSEDADEEAPRSWAMFDWIIWRKDSMRAESAQFVEDTSTRD